MTLVAATVFIPGLASAQNYPTRPIRMIVPYKGSGPALSELLGGQVSTMFDQLTSSMGFIKEGRLKVIAVTAASA